MATSHGGLPSTAFEALKAKLWGFMQAEIYPNEQLFAAQSKAIGEASHDWHWPPILIELKRKAKAQGLWNLFLPVDSAAVAGVDQSAVGGGLTNRQYAEICEIMGTSCHAEFAAMACNCTSPDTGNMEVLARYGSAEQRRRWLVPLLEGRIRSCFAMTEPDSACSDATNVQTAIVRCSGSGGEGDYYQITGRKWWATGAGDPRCKLILLMGRVVDSAAEATDPQARTQQSMVLVPMDAPGVEVVRMLTVFGYDDAPHGHAVAPPGV